MEGPQISSRGEQDSGLEPTVGEELRLAALLKEIDQVPAESLRPVCRAMARQVLVTYPAAMRFLAREAARNLGGAQWDVKRSEQLAAALAEGATGRDGMS